MRRNSNQKQLSRRDFLRFSAAATAGLLITACAAPGAPGAGSSEAASGAGQEPVTLRLAYWGFEIEKQGKVQQAFMDSHPNIKLKEEVAAWGTYWQKMLTATAAGDAPDVMAHSPYYHVRFAANNVTAPLDPFIDRDKIPLEEYYEGAISQGRWQQGELHTGAGDLHAFPNYWHTGTMWFYNKTVFENEGVALPDDTWTWDTLLDTATQLTKTKDDGTVELYGMSTPVDGNGRINSWIFQAGGDFYNEDYSKCTIKSPEAMEAFQWMTDLVLKYKVAMAPEPNQQFNPFQTGRVAIGLQGDWMITPFQDIQDFEWNIFAPPKHPTTGLRTLDAYQNGMAMTTSAKDKDAAWEYLKWVVYGEGLQKSVDIFAGSFPAHIPTAEKVVYVQDRKVPPTNLYILNELLKSESKSVFNGPAEGEIADIANTEQQAAMLQTKTVEQATTDMETRVNEVLDKARSEILG
ncbi:MAG TPA: extracellular solute-binding protein [Caldilineaceae bacterium]|nr:extracellular solute-binding protein [Caldilineaceae bacterium]